MSTGHLHLNGFDPPLLLSKKKSHPNGWLFFLFLVYTLDVTFKPLKVAVMLQNFRIFRPQVSTQYIEVDNSI